MRLRNPSVNVVTLAVALVALGVAAFALGGTSSETYQQEIAYTQTRPAFTVKRTVDVASAGALKSALANLRPGDHVVATAPFVVSGETIIKNRLSAPAELDLAGVRFVYSGGGNSPAVWINNAENVWLFGGDASTADRGNACILDYGSQYVRWWGFTAHDCGGSGFSALTVKADVAHDDFQGTIWKAGQNRRWDPHGEKGSGEHCAGEMADAQTSYTFTGNRLAFYCHDIPVGGAFTFGFSRTPARPATGNVLYLKAVNMSFVSKIQTGGNGVELWGDTDRMGLDVKYVECDNCQGRPFQAGGIFGDQNLHGVKVEYGRGTNINLNPRYHGQSAWDTKGGASFEDVVPTR